MRKYVYYRENNYLKLGAYLSRRKRTIFVLEPPPQTQCLVLKAFFWLPGQFIKEIGELFCMKQDQLGGTGEEGRNVEECRSPRSKAGGCGPNRNDLWKFHHHCPQTPVNLLLTYFSWLLFGTRPQGHWQGDMEMLSTHRKSGYRTFHITIGKCTVQ